jgi:hypothetical protein
MVTQGAPPYPALFQTLQPHLQVVYCRSVFGSGQEAHRQEESLKEKDVLPAQRARRRRKVQAEL